MSEIGSATHKEEYVEGLKRKYQELIWKNEITLLRLNDELGLIRAERARVNEEIEGGKYANKKEFKVLDKQRFSLDRNIEHQSRQITQEEEEKKYNEYSLNDLLPRYVSNN